MSTSTDVQSRTSRKPTDVKAKYREGEGEFLFTGVQAATRIPFDVMRADRASGHRTGSVVSGYPGSPLGTVDIEFSKLGDLCAELGVYFTPGVNEELAATTVMGSQFVPTLADATVEGVFGMWYGKAPGLDRATDAFRHANYGGTSSFGGALALVGDDPGAKSSTLPSSSEFALHNLGMPTFVPGTVQQVLDFGVHAAALSRVSGLWSAMRITTAIADGSANVNVAAGRITPVLPSLQRGAGTWLPMPQAGYLAYQSPDAEREIAEIRKTLARRYLELNPGINDIHVNPSSAWLGLVASGRTYYEVVEALALLGLSETDLQKYGVRLLRVGVVSPLDQALIREFAAGLEEIVVVEDGGPFLEIFVRDALYGLAGAPRVLGRTDESGATLIQAYGLHLADGLTAPLSARLTRRVPAENLRSQQPRRLELGLAAAPKRTAYFCSGCPHNISAQVPEASRVGAGIGCHGMVSFMEPARVGDVISMTQMGGEGAQWIGIQPFVRSTHLIQNLGDGTFFHSGSLAVRAAVAAGSNITYKILYNSAVAMTGGQDAKGAIPVPRLAGELMMEGVKRIIITTDDTKKYRRTALPAEAEVWHRDRIIEAQEALAKIDGVTVLIHDQQCAAEKRRDRKRGKLVDPALRLVINERVCEGCGDCGDASNCLSVQPVETEFGRKTRIDQSSCNKDYSCLHGDCPSFLSVVPARTSRRSRRATKSRTAMPTGLAALSIDPSEIPVPVTLVDPDDMTVRMPGIGGTGVVTVSQILGTAAVLDGKYVTGLDQTGFSQKAGAVVSDLRISATPVDGTNQIAMGNVDLYLVFDLLVALAENNLAGTDPDRTVVICSTSPTPTGEMVSHVALNYPDTDAMLAELDRATRAEFNFDVDAVQTAKDLFGNATSANILLVGAAYQRGCLPLSAEAIESAIALNGASVEMNTLAFRWGRLLVADPARVTKAVKSAQKRVEKRPQTQVALTEFGDTELGSLVSLRTPELVAYQNGAYAERYLALIRDVQRAEAGLGIDSSVLSETVARWYFKLLAYKDEYEVARLHVEFARSVAAEQVGEGVRVSVNLHPPLLRAMGMKNKLRFGPWTMPILRLLARAKFLRGTAFDIFGYAKVRKVERRLAGEYETVLKDIVANLDEANLATAVELAALPDLVRGYEEIKLSNVEHYDGELMRLRGALGV